MLLQTPPDVALRFDSAMASAGIAPTHRPHFRRWLRFYLDFCHQHKCDPALRSSFAAFSGKLEANGQEDLEAAVGL